MLFAALTIRAQKGEYFIHNYLPKEYNQGANNNGVAQDKEGRVFMANQSGVLVYDGLNWQIIALPDLIPAYSIINDSEGNIYH